MVSRQPQDHTDDAHTAQQSPSQSPVSFALTGDQLLLVPVGLPAPAHGSQGTPVDSPAPAYGSQGTPVDSPAHAQGELNLEQQAAASSQYFVHSAQASSSDHSTVGAVSPHPAASQSAVSDAQPQNVCNESDASHG